METTMERNNIRATRYHKNKEGLERIVNDLNSLTDVKGVAIIDRDGAIIAGITDNGLNLVTYAQVVRRHIQKPSTRSMKYPKGIFLQSLVSYNGSIILFGRIIDNVLLMVLLEKKAYLGLAMLELENSAKKAFECMYT